jgi:hypothetical protein
MTIATDLDRLRPYEPDADAPYVGETVRRVAEQIQTSIVELGMEAHLIRLQLDELLEDVDDDRELVLLDYLPDDKDERLAGALAALAALSTDDLRDLRCVAGWDVNRKIMIRPEPRPAAFWPASYCG